jgi:alpha,alpha-trehalose-phosphate synthase [UDP-forming]
MLTSENQATGVEDIGLANRLGRSSSTGGEVLFNRLVVVSNRLPVTMNRDGAGELQVSPSSGGLVTALSPVLRDTVGLWVGWPGAIAAVHLDGHLARAGEQLGCTFEPVFLSERELNDYYLGFSNQVLWPLFHDFPESCKFAPGYWPAYLGVNRRFARAVARTSGADDYIWVQDYHLLLLARELRGMGVQRQTGFFLHTPFPPPDIFGRLPWRKEIIKALLEYGLVGFQSQRDRDNFIGCAQRMVNGLRFRDRGRLTLINGARRSSAVGVFPISIDFAEFETLATSDRVEERADQLRRSLPNCQIILGVDRLDYSKGIPLRLQAYRTLLERFESLRGRVTMIQVVVPSRGSIAKYQAVKTEIEDLVAEINGRFGDQNWLPIQYISRNLDRPELVAYYRAADIALVTPVKDGMNLVAKEYCAASVDNDGVLILSEFAGAASQLRRGALKVNPFNIEGVANAIYQAFHLPAGERRARMRKLRHAVSRRDIHWWSHLFLETARQLLPEG